MAHFIRGDTVTEMFIKVMERLRIKEEMKDVVLDVTDGSIPFVFAPPSGITVPFELQEMSDIIDGEPCHNGMRYRYTTNPAQIKPNYEIDWQYSQDAALQIKTIKEMMELEKGSDKYIISFWRPARDLNRYVRRLRYGYDSSLRQRIPCGLIYQFRGARGGWHINITNRSVWPMQSFSSDYHIPATIGYYLGKKIASFTTLIYKMKQTKRDVGTKEYFDWIVRTMRKYHDKFYSWLADYSLNKGDDWKVKESAIEAARAGHYKKALELTEKLPSKTYYRDWSAIMCATEMLLHQGLYKGMKDWGLKSALLTKAKNFSGDVKIMDFVKSMYPKGALYSLGLPTVLHALLRSGDSKSACECLSRISNEYTASAVVLNTMCNSEKGINTRYKVLRKLGLKGVFNEIAPS